MTARDYAWVDGDDPRLMAACFTAVCDIDGDEVVRRFGGDLSSERLGTFEEAFNWSPDAQYVVFDTQGEGVLLAENNGWEGARPEVAEQVSKGGRLASFYWSVNADMSLLYAENGVVIAWFDPLFAEQLWVGSNPSAVGEVARGLSFGVERARTDAFVLLERLTGVRLERCWLDEPHRCVRVDPVPQPTEPWGGRG